MKPGERVIIDGYAHDGTPEALYIAVPGFTLSVQWHPNIARRRMKYPDHFEALEKPQKNFINRVEFN